MCWEQRVGDVQVSLPVCWRRPARYRHEFHHSGVAEVGGVGPVTQKKDHGFQHDVNFLQVIAGTPCSTSDYSAPEGEKPASCVVWDSEASDSCHYYLTVIYRFMVTTTCLYCCLYLDDGRF